MSNVDHVHQRRIVVLISGSGECDLISPYIDLPSITIDPIRAGTNLQALIDALNTPALPNAAITLVLSNRKAAHGLTRAAQADPPIPTAYLALQPYLKANPGKTRDDYDVEVAKIVAQQSPALVVLAGWMHIMGEGFLDVINGDRPFDGEQKVAKPIPVINLHPALPGAFDGANAIERAYEAFQKGEIKHTGAMVHRVVKEVDRGAPVLVREVEIIPGEPIETFEKRLHHVEWEIIVEATAKILDEAVPLKVSCLSAAVRAS
ncbi:Phosphoribosylglycinamide formyltransferase [Grifola frondosa]|uniref:phosphoribosylglycinamide formyltransferase 1 n=1 Tax=Grifola frondosa TaxID=5627 RepID=A0A1C7MQF1_GRIFR|nr:Phosphoribosylglycinamide formyltransferase [Grifola frondosa]